MNKYHIVKGQLQLPDPPFEWRFFCMGCGTDMTKKDGKSLSKCPKCGLGSTEWKKVWI